MAKSAKTGQGLPEPATGGKARDGAEDAAAVALASGLTVVDAAKQANVGERTLRRWLVGARFRKKVEALRAEMVARAVGKLSDGMAAAADKLVALLGSDDEGVQLRAAAAILQAGRQYRQDDELARRIAELKRLFDGEADGGAAGTS